MTTHKKPIIGVFALQGSFAEHAEVLKKLGYEVRLIRELNDTNGVTACILPGGESTTLMKLLEKTGLDQWLKESAEKGMPIYGTCAGMIILSKLGLIDIETERNAYGRQLSSFEAELDFKGQPFSGIFIRAPKVIRSGKAVEVLASQDEAPVLLRQKNILVGSFHPELTNDGRIHEFFVKNF